MKRFPIDRAVVHPVLWRLALFMEWLDRNRQRWCWATIASDLGFGWDIWNWRENASASARTCWRECDELGTCWCGKLQQSRERVEAIWKARNERLNLVK